jgi:hypothetical protein
VSVLGPGAAGMAGTRAGVPTLVSSLERLTLVYDADGGVVGELRYVVGKLAGRAHCSLCDITHGSVSEKRAWKSCRAGLGVPVEQLHRNELTPEVRAVIGGRYPAVVAHTGDGLELLLGPDELDPLGGDVDRFEARLHEALAAAGLAA